ncbi:hypothetical protein SAMN02910456_01498 [Ruminococcaceae bacterium YRB3002]|nr:hypothetical protein SAMN02910456_01498 [Ruminococcaceae bacterium YRB3002]
MKIRKLPYELTVCKVADVSAIPADAEFFFVGRTDEEISLVCETHKTPEVTAAREDGWKAFGIVGELDFALVGILSKIAGIMADNGIGIFAVSTYNTDYVLVKQESFERALECLEKAGYEIQ